MVEAQVDPMEPPKHLIKKVPKGPGSPPVPILHSPPRKLTVEDKQAWKVPPCISNWKNARGYTIPLDKRLAADGRGLQEVTINNKFATLSESLYVAERKASEDLRIRNQIRKKMAMREKEDREKDLRDMALKARMDRAGVLEDDDEDFGEPETEQRPAASASSGPGSGRQNDSDSQRRTGGGGGGGYDDRGRGDDDRDRSSGRRSDDYDRDRNRDRDRSGDRDRDRDGGRERDRESSSRGNRDDRGYYGKGDRDRDEDEVAPQGESSDDRVARQQRERLRQDRRKEREREIRLDNMKVLFCCNYHVYRVRLHYVTDILWCRVT